MACSRTVGVVFALGIAAAAALPSCEVAECEFSADCPGTSDECMIAGCFDGDCRIVEAREGYACSTGICDGRGSCGCKSANDCDAFVDACNAAACEAGGCVRVPLGDGIACSDDACAPATCRSGACVADPVPDGTPCSLGGECTPPGVCLAGVCARDDSCEARGVHEDNDTQATAYPLGTLTDCDELTICDAFGPGDEDWYVYSGIDEDCAVHATVQLDSAALEVCQYWRCADPDLAVTTCPFNTTEATAPNGAFGCCGVGSWVHDPCVGSFFDNSSATVWIQIVGAVSTCTPYTLYMEF